MTSRAALCPRRDGEALLIDATVDGVDMIFAASSSPDTCREIVEEYTAAVSQQVGAGPFSAPLGKLAAFLYARLARCAYKRARRTFIIVDEPVAAFGVAEVGRVAKGMYHTTDPSLRAEDVDRTINFFALTSEGESREPLGRAHARRFQLVAAPRQLPSKQAEKLITPRPGTNVELPFVGRKIELEAVKRYNAGQMYLPSSSLGLRVVVSLGCLERL